MDNNNQMLQPTDRQALAEKAKQPGFWRDLLSQIRLIWYLFKDSEVPIYLKIIPVLPVIYLLLPIDLVPDILLGFGQLDDLTALVVGAKMFLSLAPPHVVERYRTQIREELGLEMPAEKSPDSNTIVIDADELK